MTLITLNLERTSAIGRRKLSPIADCQASTSCKQRLTMLFRRTAVVLSRHATITPAARRAFTSSHIRRDKTDKPVIKADPKTDIKRDPDEHPKPLRRDDIVEVPGQTENMIPFEDVKTAKDLLPPGAAPGTVPSDIEQATGLERLEILGKMQGIDIFDMKPLDASRLGTLEDPIMVKSFGDEQYCGCTGFPADSHVVLWNTLSRDRPISRCRECGSVYKMEYVGPPDDPHDHHHHHGHVEAKTWADYVKEEYRGGRY